MLDDERLIMKLKSERKLREKLKRVKCEKNEAIENLAEIVKSAYQQRDAAIACAAMLQEENKRLRKEQKKGK